MAFERPHHVVIIGGGFGGLNAARHLGSKDVRVTLIDRRNFHLFQPLLYQVATGGLSAANICAPLRSVLRKHQNIRVILGEVAGFDLDRHKVLLQDDEIDFDSVVIASGSTHHYFGHEQWAGVAPGLKTIEDASTIRQRLFLAFEMAERESDPEAIRDWLTFLVVGAGPTGVELAGAITEIARHTLRSDFRSIDPASAQVILVEGGEVVLPQYPLELSKKAERQLKQLGVTVWTKAMVTDVAPGCATVKRGGQTEEIATQTVFWAAGVKASALGPTLAKAAHVETDRMGRIMVNDDLSVPGYPEVFVIGDLANFSHQGGGPLPGLAPVAMQQGKYVAELVLNRLAARATAPFSYRNYGTMATIGRHRAVAVLRKWKLSGLVAWLAWLFIHLMYIVQFQNRLLILIQWAWNYVTWNRNARLITGTEQPPAYHIHSTAKEHVATS